MMSWFLDKHQKNKQNETIAAIIYQRTMEQSRNDLFFKDYGVPDTMDGRFDLLTLHLFLVLERMEREGRAGLAQALFDTLFRDMDQSLRQVGVGDLGIPHHIKRMMKGFKGRCVAYRRAMAAQGDDELVSALMRNLYGTVENPDMDMVKNTARYMRESAACLNRQDGESVSRGDICFLNLNNGIKDDLHVTSQEFAGATDTRMVS